MTDCAVVVTAAFVVKGGVEVESELFGVEELVSLASVERKRKTSLDLVLLETIWVILTLYNMTKRKRRKKFYIHKQKLVIMFHNS